VTKNKKQLNIFDAIAVLTSSFGMIFFLPLGLGDLTPAIDEIPFGV
jgi:hypothetical protein